MSRTVVDFHLDVDHRVSEEATLDERALEALVHSRDERLGNDAAFGGVDEGVQLFFVWLDVATDFAVLT